MTTLEPSFGAEPTPIPMPPELEDLTNRLSQAIESVNRLGRGHADAIHRFREAQQRAKLWADLAYEMWRQVTLSKPQDGVSATVWEAKKSELRARLNSALEEMSEDVTL